MHRTGEIRRLAASKNLSPYEYLVSASRSWPTWICCPNDAEFLAAAPEDLLKAIDQIHRPAITHISALWQVSPWLLDGFCRSLGRRLISSGPSVELPADLDPALVRDLTERLFGQEAAAYLGGTYRVFQGYCKKHSIVYLDIQDETIDQPAPSSDLLVKDLAEVGWSVQLYADKHKVSLSTARRLAESVGWGPVKAGRSIRDVIRQLTLSRPDRSFSVESVCRLTGRGLTRRRYNTILKELEQAGWRAVSEVDGHIQYQLTQPTDERALERWCHDPATLPVRLQGVTISYLSADVLKWYRLDARRRVWLMTTLRSWGWKAYAGLWRKRP